MRDVGTGLELRSRVISRVNGAGFDSVSASAAWSYCSRRVTLSRLSVETEE